MNQCFAVAGSTIGIAIGTAGIAGAEWDIEAYDKCMDDPNTDTFYEFDLCYKSSGGVVALPPRELHITTLE
jgi:hypothetical protein